MSKKYVRSKQEDKNLLDVIKEYLKLSKAIKKRPKRAKKRKV